MVASESFEEKFTHEETNCRPAPPSCPVMKSSDISDLRSVNSDQPRVLTDH